MKFEDIIKQAREAQVQRAQAQSLALRRGREAREPVDPATDPATRDAEQVERAKAVLGVPPDDDVDMNPLAHAAAARESEREASRSAERLLLATINTQRELVEILEQQVDNLNQRLRRVEVELARAHDEKERAAAKAVKKSVEASGGPVDVRDLTAEDHAQADQGRSRGLAALLGDILGHRRLDDSFMLYEAEEGGWCASVSEVGVRQGPTPWAALYHLGRALLTKRMTTSELADGEE